jgi:serine/threonine protein kinase
MIFYEILVGSTPFRSGSPHELMYETLEASPAPPTQVRPDVPPELELVCLRCLDKDPERRYPSAAALADDLDRWLRGEPVSPPPAKQVAPAAGPIPKGRGPVLAPAPSFWQRLARFFSLRR